MATRELSILVTAKNMASRVLGQVKGDVNSLDGAAKKAGTNINRNLGIAAAAVGGAFVGGLAASVKLAGDFEAQMNTINTVAMQTPEALGAIGDSIRQISRETGSPLEDLTAAYYDLVSAGVDAADAQDVLRNANTLAIGGLGTTAETVDLLTTAMNSYGLSAEEVGVVTDQFAQAIAAGKVTAAELAGSFAQVAPTAKAYGIEIEELAAGYATLTAQGVPAAEAATQMNAAIIALIRTTGPMEKLQEQTGKNYAAIAGSQGLAEAYQQLRADAEAAGVPLIELTGRLEGTSYALAVSGDNAAQYQRNLESMGNASGVAAQQMSERQQGLNFQLTRLKTNLQDAGITIGNALIPQLADLAEEATGWLTNNQDDVKAFALGISSGFRDAAAFAKTIDWQAVGSLLTTAASFGKTMTQAFLGMPSWVQAAVVTGWGLNKVTGGALGSLVGALGSGLIKGVLGMNAGVVNINAATVNGGPGGVPAGGGGTLGRVAGGLAMGAGVAAAGIAAVEVVNFETMRNEQRAGLSGILNELPRTPARIDASIAAIERQINMERPFLEGLLFNTNIRPQLEAEIVELQNVKAAVARGESATRDAIPWHQRNVTEIQNLNASEGVRFANLGALSIAEREAINTLNASEGARAATLQGRVDAAQAAVHTLNANEGTRAATLSGLQSSAIEATRATHGPLSTIAAKNFSPVVNVTTNVNSFVSVNEWQRVARSAETAYSTNTGGI